VLDPVAPPESEYATNLTVEPVHVWHVAGGDSLVYQVELAPVERRQIKHVRFDALHREAVLFGHLTIPLQLLWAEVHRRDPAAEGSKERYLLSSTGTETQHGVDLIPRDPPVWIEQLTGMGKVMRPVGLCRWIAPGRQVFPGAAIDVPIAG